MPDPSLASELWTDVVDRIRTTDCLQGPPPIEVHRSGDGDPEKALQEALSAAGKAGLVIFVQEPLLSSLDPHRLQVRVIVDVAEEPVLNRGIGGRRVKGTEIADAIVARLNQWQPELIPSSPLRLSGTDKIASDGPEMVHRMAFTCSVLV